MSMKSTKEATQLYETHRLNGAWYPTSKLSHLQPYNKLTGLSLDAIRVLNAVEDGHGVTEYELRKFDQMYAMETRSGIIELLQLELIEPGPIEDWHFRQELDIDAFV